MGSVLVLRSALISFGSVKDLAREEKVVALTVYAAAAAAAAKAPWSFRCSVLVHKLPCWSPLSFPVLYCCLMLFLVLECLLGESILWMVYRRVIFFLFILKFCLLFLLEELVRLLTDLKYLLTSRLFPSV